MPEPAVEGGGSFVADRARATSSDGRRRFVAFTSNAPNFDPTSKAVSAPKAVAATGGRPLAEAPCVTPGRLDDLGRAHNPAWRPRAFLALLAYRVGVRDEGRPDETERLARNAARNEEVFRSVNTQIEQGAVQHSVHTPITFHCECANSACAEPVRLTPGRYAEIYANPRRFVVVAGHEQLAIERIVERAHDYLVVEKFGEAAREIDAEQQRPRDIG